MSTQHLIALALLVSLASCGDNSPFDEDYWDDPTANRSNNNEENSNQTYSVSLNTISSANLGEISGNANIEINETDVSATLNLVDVPQNLMIGQRGLSNTNCADIAAAYPPPVVVTSSTEFKNVSEVDSSSRESLIADLNQADGNNGDSVNLIGKSYVVKAYVQSFNTPQPQAATLFPIACGTIVAAAGGESDNDNDSDGTAIGGSGTSGGATTGGTTGTTGGTVGGTTAGSVGGTISGSTTGDTGGTTGGAIGGTVGGSVGGTVGGTTGGTTGTTGTTGFQF